MLKKYKTSTRLTIIAVSAIVIAIGITFWKPRIIHPVSAKEYAKNIETELNGLSGQINYYQASFVKIEEALGETQSAFYEVSTKRSYFESVTDTKKDIQDIKNLLHQLDQLRSKRKLEKPPEGLDELAKKLDDYYQAVETPLNVLLIHEQTQWQLLEASGDEYNRAVNTFDTTKDNQVYTKAIFDLEQLAPQSYERMKQVEMPDVERPLFASILNQHSVTARYFVELAQLARSQDPNLSTKIIELNARFSKEFEKAKDNATLIQEWMEKSSIKSGFEKAHTLEAQLKAELDALIDPTPLVSPSVSPTSKGKEKNKIDK